MTDTTTEYEDQTAVDPADEITLDNLAHAWADNGLPIFFANHDNICDIVENMGFTMYYLLGNHEKKVTQTSVHPTTKVSTTSTVDVKAMQLFRVTSNMLGRVVQLAADPFDDTFLSLSEEGVYSMPPIPYEMVDKLDQFFRLVDAQHGTESIVLLTYDPSKTGTEGWGIIVPDQTNTSVHCNYDPVSVAEEKPDHVLIVGSVHSHPGMSAYASGTDHHDQADFDGIHITFGWQKSVNNGATQYHFEMQMQGKTYLLQAEDVFEDRYIDGDPDPEVVEWTSKVKKALPPSITGGTQQALPTPQEKDGQKSQTSTGSGAFNTLQAEVNKTLEDLRTKLARTFGNSLETNALVIAAIEQSAGSRGSGPYGWCPSCGVHLEEFNFFSGYCDTCFVPILKLHSSAEETLIKIAYYCNDMKISSNAPVYLWENMDDGTDSLMKIIDNLADEIKQQIESGDINPTMIEPDNSGYDNSKMLCCGRPYNKTKWCGCDTPIEPDDLYDFNMLTQHTQIYHLGSNCAGCQNYYETECPRMMELVVKSIENPKIPADYFKEKITHEGCDQFTEYTRESSSHYMHYSE